MKKLVFTVLILLLGLLLGFFGVLNSVFSDAVSSERVITIVVVLLIYFILVGISALLLSESWRIQAFLLAAPGVIFLLFYMIKEYNSYYLIYMLLIPALSYLGAKAGLTIKNNKGKG